VSRNPPPPNKKRKKGKKCKERKKETSKKPKRENTLEARQWATQRGVSTETTPYQKKKVLCAGKKGEKKGSSKGFPEKAFVMKKKKKV